MIDKSLASLPRRKTDNAVIIRSQDNDSDKARVFKLNANVGEAVLLERYVLHFLINTSINWFSFSQTRWPWATVSLPLPAVYATYWIPVYGASCQIWALLLYYSRCIDTDAGNCSNGCVWRRKWIWAIARRLDSEPEFSFYGEKTSSSPLWRLLCIIGSCKLLSMSSIPAYLRSRYIVGSKIHRNQVYSSGSQMNMLLQICYLLYSHYRIPAVTIWSAKSSRPAYANKEAKKLEAQIPL